MDPSSAGQQFFGNSCRSLKTDKLLLSHKLNSFLTSYVFDVKSENKHMRQTFFQLFLQPGIIAGIVSGT